MQGMLFFVQRMDELLFHYSMDTYKAPTLNIKLLLREYLETIEQIKEGILKEKNEIPIFEEIVWCLENDRIAQKVIGVSKCEEFKKNDGSYDKDMKRKICQLFLDKLSGWIYLGEIENELELLLAEAAINGMDKRDFLSMCNEIYSKIKVSGDSEPKTT